MAALMQSLSALTDEKARMKEAFQEDKKLTRDKVCIPIFSTSYWGTSKKLQYDAMQLMHKENITMTPTFALTNYVKNLMNYEIYVTFSFLLFTV